jgi:PAS domain S-box-containing protein
MDPASDAQDARVAPDGSRVDDAPSLRSAAILGALVDDGAPGTAAPLVAALREFADALPQLIWIEDAAGHCRYTNAARRAFTGIGAGELGRGWLGSLHPDDVEHVLTTCRSAAAERLPVVVEYRLRTANGTFRWVRDQLQPLWSERQDLLGYLGSAVDITDERAALAGLRQAARRTRLLLEASTDVLFSVGPDGSIATPQPSLARYTGQPWPEHGGHGWSERIHPDDRERIAAEWQASVAARRVHHAESRHWSAQHGGYRQCEVRAIPVFDEYGNVEEWFGTLRDVHDRRMAEAESLSWRGRYESAVRAARLVMYDVAVGNPGVLWAGTPEAVLGFAADELGGAGWWRQRVHPEDIGRMEAVGREAMQRGEPWVNRYRFRARNGRYVFVEDRGQRMVDRDGIARYVGFVTDVTDQILAAGGEQLHREIERERQHLARELHDELGSMLVAARMDAAWLERERGAAPPEVRERWRRLQQVLHDGVEFKRRAIDALRPSLLDHCGLVAALRALFADRCARGGVAHGFDAPEELPPLPDHVQIGLYRIGQEALTNALKHARARRIDLRITLADDELVLTVEDDGVGVAPESTWTLTTHGISGMRHRAVAMNGTFDLVPRAGGGTRACVAVNLAQATVAPGR